MNGWLQDELVDSFVDELYKIASVEKDSTFGSEKVLTPILNRVGFGKGVGKLVEYGSADIPHTPRLFMRHRTPTERAALGQRMGESATKLVAEHPEIIPMQAVPVPGITPAYLAAKKGLSMVMKKEAALKTELQPHQQRVVDRLMKKDQPGLVAAHGLGSGKTLTSIAAQEALGLPSDIVSPASLVSNYRKELAKHLTGSRSKRNLHSMQNVVAKGTPLSSPFLVVDEAHRARESGSKTLDVLSKNQAQKRLLLTGSPFYNRPSDIAPLVNLAAGQQILPGTRKDFADRFITKNKVYPGLWDAVRGVAPGEVDVINPKTQEDLRKKLQKWVDYHPATSSDYPSVTREDVRVEMTPEQHEIYQALMRKAPSWMSRKIRSRLPPNKREAQQLNSYLSAVRQISNTTAPFDATGEHVYEPKIDSAFTQLREHLDKNPAAKAVVYSNYLDAGLNPYKKRLTEAGIPFGEFSGAMSKPARDALVQQYNEGKLRALLISSAGGEGLDLKGTRLMQILDPHWNEEKLKQVEGRGIRYKSHEGLSPEEQNVHVQRFLSTLPRTGVLEKLHVRKPGGSSDEYLVQMSENKEKLINQFRQLLQEHSVEKTALKLEKKASFVDKSGNPVGREDTTSGGKGKKVYYHVPALWEIAKGKPVEDVSIAGLAKILNKRIWKQYGGGKKSPLDSTDAWHSRKTEDADLSHPIILHPDGWIMDGTHRLLKAHRTGSENIRAVRLSEDPTEAILTKKAQVEPYQQKTQHTCSAACLVAVLGHYGFDADEHDVSGMIGVRQKGGAETNQIAETARRLGLESFEYSFNSLHQASVLTKQGIPIIADIQSFKHPGKGHYVVITDIDEKGVHLMDPNVDGNVRLISHEEMDERWWDRAMQPPHKMMPKWGVVVLPPER